MPITTSALRPTKSAYAWTARLTPKPAAPKVQARTYTSLLRPKKAAPKGYTARLRPRLSVPHTVSPPSNVTVFNGDAMTHSKRLLGDETVAAWIFDPPFPRVEYNRKLGTTTRLKISKGSNNPWFNAAFKYDDLDTIIAEANRTLVPGGHFLMKADAALMEEFLIRNNKAGRNGLVFQKTLPWDKLALGTGYIFRDRHEQWVWCTKGKKRRNVPCRSNSMSDVFRYKRLKGSQYTPAQMPVTMAHDLILQTTLPGDTIFDPYCGGGGTVPSAAAAMGRKCIGIELNSSYASRAAARVRLAKAKAAEILKAMQENSEQHTYCRATKLVPYLDV